MKQLKQLKVMREETWDRIKATEDYKLATHLDAMIPYLEKALDNKLPLEDSAVGWKENRAK